MRNDDLKNHRVWADSKDWTDVHDSSIDITSWEIRDR